MGNKEEPTLKFIGTGSIITAKEGKWIVLKNQTDAKKYEELSKTGTEIELYGIEKPKQKLDAIDEDSLFAFKE